MNKVFLLLTLFSTVLFSCDDFYFSSNETPSFETTEELINFYKGANSYSQHNGMIIHVPKEKLDNIDACIDSTMEQKYIDASIAAIVEFNKFEFINIEYVIDPSCGDQYMIFGQYDDQETDYCSEDDSGTVACNLARFNSLTGEIADSKLMYNDRVMDLLTDEDIINTAIHETGHSFGLVDLYEDEFAEISIMYYQTSEFIYTELQQFDIANIRWFYEDDMVW